MIGWSIPDGLRSPWAGREHRRRPDIDVAIRMVERGRPTRHHPTRPGPKLLLRPPRRRPPGAKGGLRRRGCPFAPPISVRRTRSNRRRRRRPVGLEGGGRRARFIEIGCMHRLRRCLGRQASRAAPSPSRRRRRRSAADRQALEEGGLRGGRSRAQRALRCQSTVHPACRRGPTRRPGANSEPTRRRPSPGH